MELCRGALITHFGCSLLSRARHFVFHFLCSSSRMKYMATGPIDVIWLTSLGEKGQNRGSLIYEEEGKIRFNPPLWRTRPFPPPPPPFSSQSHTLNIVARSRNHWCCKKQKRVCSLSYPACKARAPYYILWFVACPSLLYFSTLAHKWHDCRGKKLLNMKCVVEFPYNFCPKRFSF
jgi:hypothetical protein